MRRSRPRHQQPASEGSALELPSPEGLLSRARRHSRRGEARRALLTLRQACNLNSQDARIWALYAAQCRRMNRLDDAERAFVQALWLRERGRDEARARVLRRLLEELRGAERAA